MTGMDVWCLYGYSCVCGTYVSCCFAVAHSLCYCQTFCVPSLVYVMRRVLVARRVALWHFQLEARARPMTSAESLECAGIDAVGDTNDNYVRPSRAGAVNRPASKQWGETMCKLDHDKSLLNLNGHLVPFGIEMNAGPERKNDLNAVLYWQWRSNQPFTPTVICAATHFTLAACKGESRVNAIILCIINFGTFMLM